MTVRPARPNVAIVIPTADQDREPARTAIARARSTTAHLGATVHIIQSSGPGFRFSRSVNAGMRQAPDAQAWVLLNDDCFMDDGWLDHLLDASESHPEAGIIGARLRFPDGRLQHAGGYLLEPLRFLRDYTVTKRAPLWALRRLIRSVRKDHPYGGHYSSLRPSHRLDFVTGACMLITAACRDRIGEYDEEYEFSFEDIDYSLRCLESGLELALAVDATGVHLERATGSRLTDLIDRSEHVFHRNWGRRRILAATRHNGRRGIHHGRGAGATCRCR